jgi:phage gp37-like protein
MKEMPLTREQSRSLVGIFIAERRGAGASAMNLSGTAGSRPGMEQLERDLQATELSNARILQAARAHLSEPQLAAMQNSMNAQVKSMNTRLQGLRRQQQASGGK